MDDRRYRHERGGDMERGFALSPLELEMLRWHYLAWLLLRLQRIKAQSRMRLNNCRRYVVGERLKDTHQEVRQIWQLIKREHLGVRRVTPKPPRRAEKAATHVSL